MNVEQFFMEFQDYAAPKLDAYEQAIYLYAVRHSRLLGKEDVVIGFKSARKKLAFGVGQNGTPPSESTCYKKSASLQTKGFFEVLSSDRTGTRIKVFLPTEIPNLIPSTIEDAHIVPIEEMDFFEDPNGRAAILERDSHKCFYCLTKLSTENYVIEHVVSRPTGKNTYDNLVAACRRCNNRKADTSAENFLRVLYRENFLSGEELEEGLSKLETLLRGDLKPVIDWE